VQVLDDGCCIICGKGYPTGFKPLQNYAEERCANFKQEKNQKKVTGKQLKGSRS
jgi:hypothetical protein